MVFERMVEHLDDEFDEKGVELLNPQNFEAGVNRLPACGTGNQPQPGRLGTVYAA
jgi:hypothetical protein